MITTDKDIPAGQYDLVPVGTIPVPPTGDCKCDVKAGSTATLAPGALATVTDRKVGDTIYFDFGIPQGIKGDKGDKGDPGTSSGGGAGSISLGRGKVSVMDFGAKGDGNNDDAVAFTNAWNAVRGIGGDIFVPYPDNFYNFKSTFQAIADGSNQVWCNLIAGGMRAGKIRYTGPDNGSAIKIIGLKGANWEGLKIAIEQNKTGVSIFDIDATAAAQSTSFNSMRNMYLNLGNRPNNVAFRLGKISGGSADISDYHFDHNTIIGNEGGTPQSGQIAYLVEGVNTLACEVIGGFVAWCSNVFSNKSLPGATSSRGNSGTAYFTNVHTSQNLIDYSFNWEGTYVISGVRAESSREVFETGVGVGMPSITFIGCRFNDYKGNQIGTLSSAATLDLINCQFHKQGSPFPQMINLNSNGNSGTIRIMNGATHYNQLYTKQGNTVWKLYTQGLTRWSGPYANFTGTQHIDDINGKIL